MMKTINEIVTSSMKEQRSEFIAFLYPIEDVSKVKEIFSKHSERYKDATHNCYAYIIGKKQEWQYYSDQGEPSGTAGKPILNTLLKHDMTNVLAIVTRYYGGIKLGVRGLIDAYSDAVEQAIQSIDLIEYHAMETMQLVVQYTVLESLKHFLKTHDSTLTVTEYSENIKAEIACPEEKQVEIQNYLDDLVQKGLVYIGK
jgi:uncharacterized YigZ family protein